MAISVMFHLMRVELVTSADVLPRDVEGTKRPFSPQSAAALFLHTF